MKPNRMIEDPAGLAEMQKGIGAQEDEGAGGSHKRPSAANVVLMLSKWANYQYWSSLRMINKSAAEPDGQTGLHINISLGDSPMRRFSISSSSNDSLRQHLYFTSATEWSKTIVLTDSRMSNSALHWTAMDSMAWNSQILQVYQLASIECPFRRKLASPK